MTTPQQASSPPAPSAAAPWVVTASAAARRIALSLPPLAESLWRTQRHWILLGTLLLAILAWPLTWFWRIWSMPDSAQAYQPFVPLGALWLGLDARTRTEATAVYKELALFFPEDSPKRRGSIWPAAAGCVLMLVAYLATIPPLAMIALLAMIVGIVYYAYGPFVLSALRRPLGFLLVMAPIPNAILSSGTAWLQQGCAMVAGQILHLLHPGTRSLGTFILLPGYTLEVAGPCSGVSVLFPVLGLTLWLALFRRMRFAPAVILLCAAAGFSLLTNVLRIVAMGLFGLVNADLAKSLHDANSLAFTALAFYLTFLTANLLLRPWRLPWAARPDPLEAMMAAYYAPQPEADASDAATAAAEAPKP